MNEAFANVCLMTLDYSPNQSGSTNSWRETSYLGSSDFLGGEEGTKRGTSEVRVENDTKNDEFPSDSLMPY